MTMKGKRLQAARIPALIAFKKLLSVTVPYHLLPPTLRADANRHCELLSVEMSITVFQ